ncbi:RNA-binding protein [Legionella birminghamensis]|uniref:RNA-binding protein n=1 Tax=Legionella birminghamensis TaxID=28083 RepID=A0A378I795_9GAMM|nr:S1-like domain-containing RNA-binding protein [Legionella birminghamensis]KTC73800.1 RNA-binding protein [Legionella birminghamensis]STX30702.1 RNA-binding protein [Legionella birminghamensis]
MIKVGQYNQLRVIKEVSFGVYLDAYDWGEVLLPNKYVPKNTGLGDLVNVFIYFDSNDRMIATTSKPTIQVGECALLKVVDVNRVGAFLDWGLDKDLLVPIPEQQRPMEQHKSYLVYAKLDNQGRIIASSKLDRFLGKKPGQFKPGEEVEVIIAETTPLGRKVIINNSHWGLIHASDIFQTLHYGRKIKAYIKTVRDDGKIDVVLRKTGQENIQELAKRIMTELNKSGGFLPLHDKSSSLEIMQRFNESKKSFKSAIGQLYKRGEIIIEEGGIRLVEKQ